MNDDRALVAATLRGEVEAFGQLVRKYQRPLVGVACQLLRSREDAEDVAQEALLTAYQRLAQLQDGSKFRAWLFVILRNKCLDFLRARQPEALSLAECAELPTPTGAATAQEVLAVLHALPFSDRELLTARYLYELDYREIADMLGISVQTAYVRCNRARERLRDVLQHTDDGTTRRTLRRATGVLAFGLPGVDFVPRILRQVQPVASATPPPAAVTNPRVNSPGVPAWLPAAGGKMLIGLTTLLLLACVHFAPQCRQPTARHWRRSLATPRRRSDRAPLHPLPITEITAVRRTPANSPRR